MFQGLENKVRSIKRILVNSACKSCNSKQTVLETNFSFDLTHLQYFLNNGYTTNKSYGTSGILFVQDETLIATSVIGQNKMQIKCRNDKCDEGINKLEAIIKSM
jgi:hypothetical protein